MWRIKVLFKYFWQMLPRARKYGIRYFWDEEFRRLCKQREYSKKQRKKYGCFYKNREELLDSLIRRDGLKCRWCDTRLTRWKATIDHIEKVAIGGRNNSKKNLQILCRECHTFKDTNWKRESNTMGRLFKDVYLGC